MREYRQDTSMDLLHKETPGFGFLEGSLIASLIIWGCGCLGLCGRFSLLIIYIIGQCEDLG